MSIQPVFRYLTVACTLLLAACATHEPAPVIDRMPPTSKAPTVKSSSPAAANQAGKDWRPDRYTVKKGDTLFSIGLEYGYDYKEIAQANNIAPPYIIRIGQQLQLKSLDSKESTDPSTGVVTAPLGSGDGNVVIRPLGSDSNAPASATSPATGIPVLSEPKALRVPYSEQAMQVAPVKPAVIATTAPAAAPSDTAKPAETKPADAKPADTAAKTDTAAAGNDESLEWIWPTNGKVIGTFSDTGSGKGIDIAGSQGQPVVAAAPGKVIYSGSDLRGYGKLVIIKHNKTYLSVYAHNNQILVKEGQQVSRGQKIAEMGNSDTDKVKLHFEIRQQGKSVDPAKYLPGSNP
ncbi:peptidoglycan DD-metalloendopeptidase family protein [Methylovorus menthalis]|nr:peptidoglycan DD-metalloendopeptidase family protein [Methylovorus menthalis]MCB4812132.1 peptidoglycan DD-metalloendopeptidase family protein [Methylovorus menthalis]